MHKKNDNNISKKHNSRHIEDSLPEAKNRMQQYDLTNQFQKNHVNQYFDNLLDCLSDKMIIDEKKNKKLPIGLYILLKGKISYSLINKKHSIDNKSLISNSSKSKLHNHFDPFPEYTILHNSTIIFSKPFTIIQCQFQNCILLQDSTLIKIQQDIRRITKFDELYQGRLKLIHNCHLNGEMFANGKLFYVNTKIHSSFKFYTHLFHHTFKLGNVGIINSGLIRPLKSQVKKLKGGCFQLQKQAVVLPGIQYEVTSAEVQIMTIQNNSTLSYIHPELVSATSFLKLYNEPCFFLQSPDKYFHIRKNKELTNSIYVSRIIDDKAKDMNKPEIKKRNRQFIDLSKKYHNEFIVTMETCKQHLQFSQKQTSLFKQSKYHDEHPNSRSFQHKNVFENQKQFVEQNQNKKTRKIRIQRESFPLVSKLLMQQKNPRKFRITAYEQAQQKYKNNNEFYDSNRKQRNSQSLKFKQPGFYVRALTKSMWTFPKI